MESAEPLRSTARLRRDHEKITGVLDAVEALTRRLRRGRDVPPATIIGALDFFAAFVDRCHRVKEEEGLLPLLRQRGMPDDSSLTRAEAEHGEARRLLSRLRQVGTRGKIDAEGTAWLETYVALLRRHMAAEEAVLFPLADRVLSSADDARLLRSFLHVERHSVGPAGLAAAFALAEAVTDACREIGVERANRQRDARAGHAVRPKLATVAPEDSLAQALELMEAVGTRELPVVEGGVLVGILARRDLEPHRGQYEWTKRDDPGPGDGRRGHTHSRGRAPAPRALVQRRARRCRGDARRHARDEGRAAVARAARPLECPLLTCATGAPV